MSTALALASDAPWWAYLLLGLAGPVAYIYRLHGLYRLAGKALDKAESDQVAAIMTTVTGRSAQAPPDPSSPRRRARRRARGRSSASS